MTPENRIKAALDIAVKYGGIDGDHHAGRVAVSVDSSRATVEDLAKAAAPATAAKRATVVP